MKQKTRNLLGWISIFAISLIPVLMFFALGNGAQRFTSFSYSLYGLGEISALIGATLFALNFVLSTRLRFLEEIFGGMDRVYLVHGITGGIAFMMILAHPLLIVAELIPNNIVAAAGYFIPGPVIALDFGLIAVLGLISLMFITFFVKIKYNRWKYTHEFLGLVFVFAVLHMFFVRGSVSVDYIFRGYYLFVSAITAVGLSAFTYSLIVRKKLLKYPEYKIKKIDTGKDSVSLELEPVSKPIAYKSGQFVFARFYSEKVSKEPHPFSISSKSGEKIIKVHIRKSGDFTGSLENLTAGEKVTLEGPYGRFNFRNFEGKEQIWIAAGIGITPFLGMIDELKENSEYKVSLFYTFRENYIIGKEILDKIKSIGNLKFIPWNSSKRGRMTTGEIIRGSELKNKEILICGPFGFKEEFAGQLREIGIEKDKIHEEVFDLK